LYEFSISPKDTIHNITRWAPADSDNTHTPLRDCAALDIQIIVWNKMTAQGVNANYHTVIRRASMTPPGQLRSSIKIRHISSCTD